MMAKIVLETEGQDPLPRVSERGQPGHVRLSVAETICESMAHAAEDLDISAIAVFTETGTTARQLSKYRPKSPIFGLSSVERGDPSHDPALGRPPHPLQQAGDRGTDGRNRRAPARSGRPRAAAADPGHCRRHPHQVGLDEFSPPARAGRHALPRLRRRAKTRRRIPRQAAGQDQRSPPSRCRGGCAPAAKRSLGMGWSRILSLRCGIASPYPFLPVDGSISKSGNSTRNPGHRAPGRARNGTRTLWNGSLRPAPLLSAVEAALHRIACGGKQPCYFG